MSQIQNYFYVNISEDRLKAMINCTEAYKELDANIDVKVIYNFLHDKNITFGIDNAIIKSLLKKLPISSFPLPIAKGVRPENGVDGSVHYELDFSTKVDRTLDTNFRDVMRIPSVKRYQKLATITMPTRGKNGTDVFGNSIQARPGKPVSLRAGKNVKFKEEERSFYSTEEGQASTRGRYIEVHPLFELGNTLSMQTGNIDFVGSVIINGDVPTGYTVKAAGDVKVFGIVEAATIIAGGSVFVSEGLAGLQKGCITAEKNVHIGYINQGIVNAGESLHVENSIIHSKCVAKEHVFCQQGNIIGGSLSAGKSIEAKDVGNRLNTETVITLSVIKIDDGIEERLKKEKRELESTLKKLALIRKSLIENMDKQDVKTKITLLRQRNSYEKTFTKLTEVKNELNEHNASQDNDIEPKLIVRNYIYPNVTISYGRYKRKIKQVYQYVQVKFARNEILVDTL